jgi:hypothetical protein
MAKVGRLYISEYGRLGKAAMEALQGIPNVPPMADHCVDVHDDLSVVAPEFDRGTGFISVEADCPCFLAFGHAPEAKPYLHPLSGKAWYSFEPGRVRLAVIGLKTDPEFGEVD